MRKLQQTIVATLFVLFTTIAFAQEASLTVKGKVYDKEAKHGIEKAEVRLFNDKGVELKAVVANSLGQYQLDLGSEVNIFRVEAKAKNYNQAEVLVAKNQQEIVVDFGLYLQEISVEKVELPTLYFDLNSSYLTKKAKEELKQVVLFMENNPMAKIRVNGHTDVRGTDSYNDWLSARRAEQVRKWLIDKGRIGEDRIEEQHFGKTQLSNSCGEGMPCSKEKHRENRRCDFEILTR